MTGNKSIIGVHNLLEFEYFPEGDACSMRALHTGLQYCVVRRLSMSPEVVATPGVAVSLEAIRLLMEFVRSCDANEQKEG